MFVSEQVISVSFSQSQANSFLPIYSLYASINQLVTHASGVNFVIYSSWEETNQPVLPKYSQFFIFVPVFNWIKFSVLSFPHLKALKSEHLKHF